MRVSVRVCVCVFIVIPAVMCLILYKNSVYSAEQRANAADVTQMPSDTTQEIQEMDPKNDVDILTVTTQKVATTLTIHVCDSAIRETQENVSVAAKFTFHTEYKCRSAILV